MNSSALWVSLVYATLSEIKRHDVASPPSSEEEENFGVGCHLPVTYLSGDQNSIGLNLKRGS